jgi:hypothetical protein
VSVSYIYVRIADEVDLVWLLPERFVTQLRAGTNGLVGRCLKMA